MTNRERRQALAQARRKALEYALEADQSVGARPDLVDLANMWANVAAAMKVGQSLEADGPDGEPEQATIYREGLPVHPIL
jgi:hypothetical protein